MKNKVLISRSLSFVFLSASSLFAQDKTTSFDESFQPIQKELTSWDAVRGEWLAKSMVNVSKGLPIPDRNFPENFTPFEMFQVLPAQSQRAIEAQVTAQQTATTSDASVNTQWKTLGRIIRNTSCSSTTGRTYGDPHLTSLDGASLSFQTVGEFTLSKSTSGNFNVQTRQSPSSSSVSLNTAVAMWVNGNRVCFYGKEKPDGNSSTPIRIEGEAVYMEKGRPHFLSNGGIINQSGNDYTISWPTGERVKVFFQGGQNSSFLNVVVEVFPCNDSYTGLLGNGNGNRNDDFTNERMPSTVWDNGTIANNGNNSQAEKIYLGWAAKEYGELWRITQSESLFDYGFGQSTATFTDVTFPLVHLTMADMNETQRGNSRRECERLGLTGIELNNCMFDNVIVGTPAAPAPVVVKPERPVPPTSPVSKPGPNTNPGGPIGPRPNPNKPVIDPSMKPVGDNGTIRIPEPNTPPEALPSPKKPGDNTIETRPRENDDTPSRPSTPSKPVSTPVAKPSEDTPVETKPTWNWGNKPVKEPVSEPSKPTSTPSSPAPAPNRPAEPKAPSPSKPVSAPAPRPEPRPTPAPRPAPAPAPRPAPTPKAPSTPVGKPSGRGGGL